MANKGQRPDALAVAAAGSWATRVRWRPHQRPGTIHQGIEVRPSDKRGIQRMEDELDDLGEDLEEKTRAERTERPGFTDNFMRGLHA